MDPAEPALLRIEVADCVAPGEVQCQTLQVAAGTTVSQALQAVGKPAVPGRLGIWGQLQPPDRLLSDGDRIELYRPLQVDPKEARRLRDQARPLPRRPRGRRG